MKKSEPITVVIPVWNEKEGIEGLISHLKEAETGHVAEILVSDGGSTDGTAEVARSAGARVILSPRKGRAAQMNAGAEAARGEILYFLHADTLPPNGFDTIILSELRRDVAAGCFRLQFDETHPALQFYSHFTRLHSRFLRFGDQSLFLRRKLFQKIGGFREELIVMEDQEIFHRIKNEGIIVVASEKVITSARKYRENGYLRLQLLFTLIWAGYYLGIPQDKLVSFYRSRIR